MIISLALLPFFLYGQDGDKNATSKQTAGAAVKSPIIVDVEPYIHHISDINFRDQQYKIEVWLKLTMSDTLWAVDSLASQFAVVDSKDLSVTVVPQYQRAKDSIKTKKEDSSQRRGYRRLLKLNCTIIKKWDIKKYPFNRQTLDIKIYALRSSKWWL